MNKFKDSFASFKLASMTPFFHISYFAIMQTIKIENEVSQCNNYSKAFKIIQYVHASGAFQLPLFFVLQNMNLRNLQQIISYIQTILYLLVVIFLQTTYYSNHQCVETITPLISQWILIEIVTWWAQIISAIIFITKCQVFDKKDANQQYQEFMFYSYFSSMAILNGFMLYSNNKDSSCKQGSIQPILLASLGWSIASYFLLTKYDQISIKKLFYSLIGIYLLFIQANQNLISGCSLKSIQFHKTCLVNSFMAPLLFASIFIMDKYIPKPHIVEGLILVEQNLFKKLQVNKVKLQQVKEEIDEFKKKLAEEQENDQPLELDEDIYCLSYLGHLSKNRVKFNILDEDIAQNFKSCCFISFLQLLLIYLISNELLTDGGIVYCDYDVLLTRFLCTIFLHIQIEQEVRMSLQMIRYFLNHSDDFDSHSYPVLICFLKFLGALLTEIVNILLICSAKTSMESVMNFVALAVIADFDNLYANSLQDLKLKKALEDENLPVITHKKEAAQDPHSIHLKVLRKIYQLLKLMFASFYFYFMPYLTIILTQMYGEEENTEK